MNIKKQPLDKVYEFELVQEKRFSFKRAISNFVLWILQLFLLFVITIYEMMAIGVVVFFVFYVIVLNIRYFNQYKTVGKIVFNMKGIAVFNLNNEQEINAYTNLNQLLFSFNKSIF